MNTLESFQALRRANPRTRPGFTESVELAARKVRAEIVAVRQPVGRRPRLVRVSAAGVTLAAVAVLAVFMTVGSPGGNRGVEDAAAAMKHSAIVTAAAAERSGTATVRITHDGRPWAGKTVRWSGSDMSIVDDEGRNGGPGAELRVVGGTLYAPDLRGGWVNLGPEESIDPGSGTTPAEQLAAVREDLGGVSLRRVTRGMTGLSAGRLADGTIVYRGDVAAGLIARESGFKEGHAIRVFPFGYVAHDQAADPAAPLDTAVTVGPDGIVRELLVTWGTWTYTVAYNNLGATAAPIAPANARPLRDRMPGRAR